MQVTSAQVERFFDAVRELNAWPSDESRSAAAIREKAQRAREEIHRCFGIVVPAGDAALQVLDDLLNAMHEPTLARLWISLSGGGNSHHDAEVVSSSIGACIGELAQARMGGHWGFQEFKGQRYISLILGPDHALAVLQKAGKQFANGQEGSVQLFFGIVSTMATAKARIANLSPEDREALKAKAQQAQAERKAKLQAMSPEERKAWARQAAEAAAERIRKRKARGSEENLVDRLTEESRRDLES